MVCLAMGILVAASAGAEPLYRLPWADGLSFMLTQVPGGRITTHFTKATWYAVDIAMPEGMPVVAARSGVVEAVEARYGASLEEEPLTYEGNFVRIRHADGSAATYAHLRHQGVAVAVGETVAAGRLLGYSGATGDVVQSHLHFVVTRAETNASGWREDVSVPVTFYIGEPPTIFAPRAALRVTANYAEKMEAPRAPSEARLVPWASRVLEPGEETRAWILLALWVLAGIAGMGWFWKFTQD